MGVQYNQVWEGHKRNVIVMGEDEAKNRIKYRTVTDMVSVNFEPVCPLGAEDPNRYIYGQISVKVGKSNVSVPVFSRTREDPALVVLKDRHRNFLSLPDGVDPPPALEAVTQSNSIRITMTLHEKMSSGPDELIAQITDWEYTSRDNVLGSCGYIYIDVPKPKYVFQVCYAVIWGARAEIEVKIKPPMEEEEEGGSIPRKLKPPMEEEEEEGGGSITRKRKRSVSISAKIAVVQNMKDDCYNCPCGQTIRTLYDRSEEEVCVGDKLELQRSVFGLPMADNQFLTLVFTPPTVPATVPPKKPILSIPEDPVLVDLIVKQVAEDSSMTITEDVPGTPFSVSIRILPIPGKEPDEGLLHQDKRYLKPLYGIDLM